MTKYQDIAILLLRLATAANFLSPVADRFDLWGTPGTVNVGWGNWENFVDCISALLLATVARYKWSVDELLQNQSR